MLKGDRRFLFFKIILKKERTDLIKKRISLKFISMATAIMLIATLFCAAGGLKASAVSVPSTLKIGLYYGSNARQSLSVTSERGFYLGYYEDRTFVERIITDALTVTVSIDGAGTMSIVNSGTGETLYTQESGVDNVGLRPIYTNFWEERLYIDDSGYRGSLKFLPDGGAMTIINMVDMDQYLYGVVSREMSSTWPAEALKAQTVCARNYAANNIDKHSNYGFDLCSGTDCQAYSGMSREEQSIYDAVDATAGQVLTYNGELAELYYSSSMGPMTEDVQNVWGSSVPYLVSVDNSYEDTANIPNGVWEGTLTVDEASTIMRNKGYDVGDVTNIEAIEYSPAGRVTKLRVTGTTAVKTFELEECRTIFNTVTKSQMYEVIGDGEENAMTVVYATDGESLSRQRLSSIEILSSIGRSNFSSTGLNVTNGETTKTYTENTGETEPNTYFTFTGTGWGHGVGMSQYGAKGLAEAGYDYQTILLHYFPGTEFSVIE